MERDSAVVVTLTVLAGWRLVNVMSDVIVEAGKTLVRV